MSIGLIVLAAGGSTRMGRPKQLLPWRGQPLIRHAAATALATSLRPVLVVLGNDATACTEVLHGLPVELVVNPDWSEGIASSIRAGIAALAARPEIEGALLTLHDQPHITAEALQRLATTWKTTSPHPTIVASAYNGILGVPALFARALFPALQSLTGHEGAKKLIALHGAELVQIPLPEAALDLDTPEEYARSLSLPSSDQ